MNLDGCFFDLDGTLCDTAPDIVACWRQTLETRGLPWECFEAGFRIGPPLEPTIRGIYPDRAQEWIAELISEFRAMYLDCGFPKTRPYPGIPELLEELRKRGVRLFVATNKSRAPSLKILRENGLLDYFEEVLTPESSTGGNQTKAELLKSALQRHGLTPSSCAMIGDTPGDIQAGKAAGMQTVGVLWGYGDPAELQSTAPTLFWADSKLLTENNGYFSNSQINQC